LTRCTTVIRSKAELEDELDGDEYKYGMQRQPQQPQTRDQDQDEHDEFENQPPPKDHGKHVMEMLPARVRSVVGQAAGKNGLNSQTADRDACPRVCVEIGDGDLIMEELTEVTTKLKGVKIKDRDI